MHIFANVAADIFLIRENLKDMEKKRYPKLYCLQLTQDKCCLIQCPLKPNFHCNQIPKSFGTMTWPGNHYVLFEENENKTTPFNSKDYNPWSKCLFFCVCVFVCAYCLFYYA